MQILHVHLTMNPEYGGPVEAIRAMTTFMMQKGHGTEIVTADDPAASFVADCPTKLHAMGRPWHRYGYTPRMTPWLHRNASRFDVAILHGLWNYAGLAGWRALRPHMPYVVFNHGMLSPWLNAVQPVKRWAKQAYWLGIQGRILADAQAVLFTAEDERRQSRTAFFGHRYHERVVPFGAAEPPSPTLAGQAAFLAAVPRLGARPYLLFLGRLHPNKGCDLLIDAFADIAADHPDTDLVIAGPDQLGWRAALEAMAQSRGVSARIHWAGMLQGDTKWAAFRGAEAYILPSHSENFGIAVAEAMACSTPVLISDKVNIWREVEASGGLVAPDTRDGTRALLSRFLSLAPSEKTRLRAAARRGYETHFAMATATDHLLDVLASVVSAHRDPAMSRRSS